MKRIKYLFTFFIGTLTYVFLSVVFGQNSIRCFNQLENQKQIISNQVAELQNINRDLSMEVTALKHDRAVIAAYARKLDYVSDGEKLVKITGLKRTQPILYDTGTIIRHDKPVYLSEISCKIIALFLSIVSFALIFLYDFNKGDISFSKKRKPAVSRVPVYDLQQA